MTVVEVDDAVDDDVELEDEVDVELVSVEVVLDCVVFNAVVLCCKVLPSGFGGGVSLSGTEEVKVLLSVLVSDGEIMLAVVLPTSSV